MKFEIFADDFFHENFLGIGCLFVPLDKKVELVDALSNKRCLGDNSKWEWDYLNCPFNENCKDRNFRRYHVLNNCQVHYQDLATSSSGALKDICKGWIDFLLDNNLQNRGLVYFKILYVDLSLLDEDFFGGGRGVRENVYNRFFRSAIIRSRLFFGSKLKEICKIYHHQADSREIHPYFSYNVGERLNRYEDDFRVIEEEIQFINGNHKVYFDSNPNLVYESQLIQFIDLVLGVCSRNFFNLSRDDEKIGLAQKIRPLVERLVKNPSNQNSSYNYYRKQEIDIFPKSNMKTQRNLFDNPGYRKGMGKFTKPQLITLPRINESGPLDQWIHG